MKDYLRIPAQLLLCFCLMLHCPQLFAQPLPDLIPYVDDGKWGYADTNGVVRITPQWDEVFFFVNGKAIVKYQSNPKDYSNAIHCLIDKKGNYIIPPERKWTGEFKGWKGDLNAKDEMGNWGMIDTNNHVLIPFEWEVGANTLGYTTFDTVYKAVYKNRKSGIIDRNNQQIIDCNYDNIYPITDSKDSLLGFRVSPTNSHADFGVIAPGNKILVPTRYYEMMYHEGPEGKGFKVSRYLADTPAKIWAWVDINTGKETKLSDNLEKGYHYETKFGYVLFGHGRFGLMDTNYKELIPCCDIIRMNADTIIMQKVLDTSDYMQKDSIPILTTALNTKTLKPYFSCKSNLPGLKYALRSLNRYDNLCGNGYKAMRELEERERNMPRFSNGSKTIWTDSVEYKINGFAPVREYFSRLHYPYTRSGHRSTAYSDKFTYLTVWGSRETKNGTYHYTAIANGEQNFEVKPIRNGYIKEWNKNQGLLTIHQEYGYPEATSYILNINAERISPEIPQNVLGALRIDGKLYVILENNTLADSTGEAVKSLNKYTLSFGHFMSGNKYVLAVKDSAGFQGFVTIEGKILFPDISFKYKDIYAYSEYIFAIMKDADKQEKALINRKGNIISPPEGISDIRLASNQMSIVDDQGYSAANVFVVTRAIFSYFYMDKYGRMYKGR